MSALESRLGYLERRVERLAELIGTTVDNLDDHARAKIVRQAEECRAEREAEVVSEEEPVGSILPTNQP